jgi:hypothetical protein
MDYYILKFNKSSNQVNIPTWAPTIPLRAMYPPTVYVTLTTPGACTGDARAYAHAA